MKNKLNIVFYGPLSWVNPSANFSIFYSEVSNHPGIYLWTVGTSYGDLIYYVGETGRNFRTRMRDHYKEQLSGMYHIYDPEQFSLGKKKEIWPGVYGKGGEKDLTKFLDILPTIAPDLIKFVSIIQFYVAPINWEGRIRKRFEAALANYLYKQPGTVGDFQDKGIRYEPRRENEEPIMVNINFPKAIKGMPKELIM
jgi:hypothetical protein